MNDGDKLLAAASKGNIEAFEQLIGPYQRKVYNIFLQACGDEEDASLLAQEAFLRVFRCLGDIRGEKLLSTCIYKATRDVCVEVVGRVRKIS